MLVTKREVRQTSKKLLSVLLAVIMIMTSMSVCFSVFAADANDYRFGEFFPSYTQSALDYLVKALESDTIKSVADNNAIGGGKSYDGNSSGGKATTGDSRYYTTYIELATYNEYVEVRDTLIYLHKAILETTNYSLNISQTSDNEAGQCVTFDQIYTELMASLKRKNANTDISAAGQEFVKYVLESGHAQKHSDNSKSKVNGTVTNTISVYTKDYKGYLETLTGDYTTAAASFDMGYTYYLKMTGKHNGNNLCWNDGGACGGTDYYHHYIWKAYWDPANNPPAANVSNTTTKSTLTTYANYVDNFLTTNTFDSMAAKTISAIETLEKELADKTTEIKNYIADAGEGKQDEMYNKLFPGYADRISAFAETSAKAKEIAKYTETVAEITAYQTNNPNYGVFNWGGFDEATIKDDYADFMAKYGSIINDPTLYDYFVRQGKISDTYYTNFSDNVDAYDLEDLRLDEIDPLYNEYALSFPMEGGEEATLEAKSIVYGLITGYIGNIYSYSDQVQEAIFPAAQGGINYLLDFQEKLECQVSDCVVYFAQNVNKDYSDATTEEVIAEIATAKAQLAALNALNDSIDYQDNRTLLTPIFEYADTFIAYLYSLLADRFTAQVNVADEAYTALGRPTSLDLPAFSKLNVYLAAIEETILTFIDGEGQGSLITQETREKYNALKVEVFPAFDAFLVDRGFSQYTTSDILIRREDKTEEIFRENTDKDGDNVGEYEVTDENVNAIIELLEAALKDPQIKKILGDLINKDEDGKPTGEAFDLAVMLSTLIEENVYTDALLNTIIGFLYPAVANIFTNVWSGIDPVIADPKMKIMGQELNVYVDLYLKTVEEATEGLGLYLYPTTLAKKLRSNYSQFNSVADVLDDSTTKAFVSMDGDGNPIEETRKNPWNDEVLYTAKLDKDGNVVTNEETGETTMVLNLDWGIDESENKKERFLQAAQAALSGIEPLLLALLCNKPMNLNNGSIGTGEGRMGGYFLEDVTLIGDVTITYAPLDVHTITLALNATANDGYNNVLAPLFEILTGEIAPDGNDFYSTRDFLEDGIIEPLEEFIDALAANPLEVILDVIPNLMYAIEADLLLTKLDYLSINIDYSASAIINADLNRCTTTASISIQSLVGILSGMIEDMTGLTCDSGVLKDINAPDVMTDSLPVEISSIVNIGELLGGVDLSSFAGIWSMISGLVPMLAGAEAPDASYLTTLGTLGTIDTVRSQKQYTYGGAGKAAYITANRADVLKYLVKWVLESGLLAGIVAEPSELISTIFANLEKNSGDAVAAIVELLNQQPYPAKNYEWFSGTIDGENVLGNSAYEIYLNPENDWTKEKAQYLYDNLEALLGSIFTMAGLDLDKETEGAQTSLDEFIGGAINGLFTDKTLTALAGILAKLDLNALLNKDKTPEEAAKSLDVNALINSYLGLDLAAIAAQYAPIAAELEANPEYVHNFGATDAASFVDALVDMLEPLSDVLDFILAGESLTITINGETVELLGAEGYKNGIIPLLEALGCEVVADPENALEATLNALVGLINKLTTNTEENKKDGFLYGVIDLLPGLFYYLTSNGLSTTVLNLLQPVLVIVDTIRPVIDVMDIISAIEIGEEGNKKTLVEFLGGEAGDKLDLEHLNVGFIFDLLPALLPDLDLSGLENVIYDICNSVGVEYTSAAAVANTVNGKAKKGAYNANLSQADLLTVVLSFVLEWATVEENAKALDEMLGTNGIIASLKNVFADVKIDYGTPNWMYWFNDDADAFNAYIASGEGLPNTLASLDWDAIEGTNDWDKDTAQYFANNIGVLVDKIIAMINADKEDAPKTLAALLDGVVNDNLGGYFTADTINDVIGKLQDILVNVDDVLLNVGYELLNVDLAGLKAYTCTAEINDLASFVNELARVLDTYAAGLIDLLFFGDDIRIAKKSDRTDTIVINGGLGYEKGLALILEALGCELPELVNGKTTATAVLGALVDRVNDILADPVNEILDLLPNLVYFLNANGAGVAVSNLLAPVNVLIDKINALGLMDPIDLEALIGIDLDNLSLENVATIVEGATGLKLDAAEAILVNFCTGKITKGEYIYKMEAAREDVITILLVVALELISDEEFAAKLDEMLGTDFIAGIKEIFAESEIVYAAPDWNYMDGIVTDAGVIEYVNAVTAYPNDWTEEKAAELTAQLPALVDTVIKMIEINGTKYESLSALLTDVLADANIFSTATLESLLGLIKNLLGNIDAELLKVGYVLDVKLPELMAYEVPADIDTVAEFADTLAFVLGEYAPGIVEWLLLGRDFKLLVKDANGIEEGTTADGAYITISGAQGYAEGLALLLEALGCENLPAATGETKSIVSGVLASLAARIDEIIANPVAEVLDLLPNLIYFLDANGVAVVIENTTAALMALIDKLSAFGITLDINSLVDLPALMGIADKYAEGEDKLGLDNLTLAALLKALSLMTDLDFTELENVLVPFALGEAVPYTSVSRKTAYKMVYKTEYDKHDMVSVIVSAALRMFVENEENAAKLDEMLGTEIVAKLKDVFADVEIAYTEITWDYDKTGDGEYMLTYPNNWNKDTAKAVTVLLKDKEFEALIAGLIDANYDSFSALLNDKVNVFTTANLQAIVDLIANLLAGIDDGLLAAAGLLLDVDVVGLKGYKAPEGITTVDAFAAELANVLTTYASGVIEWLLLGEDYRFFVKEVENGVPVDFITINGAKGYTEGLAVLLEALGVAAPAVIVKDGAVDTTATVAAVLDAVADRIDEIFANPVEEVIELLPNLIYFLNTNGVAAVVDNTLAAVYALLDKLTAFGVNVDIKSLVDLKALMGIENTDAKIALDNITIATLLEAVSYMVEGLDLTIVESVLVSFDLGATAAYESVSTEVGTAKKMTLADYDTVTIIANLLLLTVKDEDNAEFLKGLVGEEIYDMIIDLFNMENVPIQEFNWLFTSEETGGNKVGETFSTLESSEAYDDWPMYGPFYTEEMATYIAENFGMFVDNILYLLGLEVNGITVDNLTDLINGLLDGSLYTADNVIAIRDGLAGVLASVAELEVNGTNVGKHIVAVLKAAKVADLEAVGKVEVAAFTADGTEREQFVAALCDVLAPLYNALRWLLANEDISFFVDTDGSDLITLKGGEGYAYGIIPLLEVLGCENILTPDEYYEAVKADGSVLLTSILDPLLDRVDEIIAAPADEILDILPNIFYFINSNGLDTVVKNTLNAVYSLLKVIEPVAKIDIYALIGIDLAKINMTWLFEQLLDLLASAGYEFDLKDLNPILELTVGTLEEYTSVNGDTAYRMVYEAGAEIGDVVSGGKEELVSVILRLLVTFLFHEKNAEVLVDLLVNELGMTDAEEYLTRLIKSIAKVPTTTYLGMNQAQAVIYYLFYGADIGAGGVAGGLKDINAEWQKILKELGKSDDPNEQTIGNILSDLLGEYMDDVLTGDGLAPNGFISFFQKIINWFQSIIEWFKNLFN